MMLPQTPLWHRATRSGWRRHPTDVPASEDSYLAAPCRAQLNEEK
jgi:hypothetical protein